MGNKSHAVTNNIHYRTSLSIMSWNIQDHMTESSNKFQSKDFTKHLEGIDIICLQETKGAVKHENYTSYNSNRTDSRSGGVAILVHNHIKKGIIYIYNF